MSFVKFYSIVLKTLLPLRVSCKNKWIISIWLKNLNDLNPHHSVAVPPPHKAGLKEGLKIAATPACRSQVLCTVSSTFDVAKYHIAVQ